MVNWGTAASDPAANSNDAPAEPIASANDALATSAICTA